MQLVSKTALCHILLTRNVLEVMMGDRLQIIQNVEFLVRDTEPPIGRIHKQCLALNKDNIAIMINYLTLIVPFQVHIECIQVNCACKRQIEFGILLANERFIRITPGSEYFLGSPSLVGSLLLNTPQESIKECLCLVKFAFSSFG